MTFTFSGSDKPTLGVELELQLVETSSLDLLPFSERLLDVCQKLGIDRVKPETHKSVIEIDTDICNDVKECSDEMQGRMQNLIQVTEALRIDLNVTATHPFQRWPERQISNVERYQNLYEKYQWLFRRMNVLGLHVHVGVPTGEIALAICRAITPYLPHLLALSANSPYWQGVDTGMQSSRLNIMDSFPFSRMPNHVTNWKEFEHYYSTLKSAGAVGAVKDLYWFARPNLSFGTVEIRICDAMTTLWENMAIVALIHCLIVWLSENDAIHYIYQKEHVEYSWLSSDNQFTAARDGLDGMIIVSLDGKRQKISDGILELLEKLEPISRRLRCEKELQDIRHILSEGNGAERQRKIFGETGSLKEVVSHSIKTFKESYLSRESQVTY